MTSLRDHHWLVSEFEAMLDFSRSLAKPVEPHAGSETDVEAQKAGTDDGRAPDLDADTVLAIGANQSLAEFGVVFSWVCAENVRFRLGDGFRWILAHDPSDAPDQLEQPLDGGSERSVVHQYFVELRRKAHEG
ncbi:MAG TPA: hypothetical protein VFU02_04520 [Polyangiaceae bacterium]|nr:hypothetical protein [Polyangiaceae bacterium]